MIMVITVTLLAAYALTTLVIYRQNVGLMERETRQEADYIVKAIEISGTDYLKQMDEVEKNTRITLIDPAGDVLYDSTEDAVTLQNHKNRPEIKAAHKNGTGQEVRRSMTMSKEMFYYAKLLPDGNVLRVSKTMNTALHTAISILPIMGLIAVVALAFAYLLSRQQVAKLIRPINELDLEEPLENEVYEELTPLLESIDKQNKEKEAIANMRKEFSANVSHELKTPLTSISGYAEIMKSGIVKPEDMPRFSEKIYNEARRLITLVEDIIKLSHLDEGKVELERQDVDFYELTREIISRLSPQASAKKVHMELTGESVIYNGVRQILDEMVYNICENAIKYNKEGGEIRIWVGNTLNGKKSGIVKPEDMPRFSEKIYNEARRLITLVEDIIKLSHLDEGKVELERQDVDFYELTREIISRLSPQASAKKVHMELTGESVIYNGVRQILDEMVYNICENAIKYNKEGGEIRIWVGNTLNGKKIIVTDTGIGIPEDQKERIFERFYRVDKSHSREIGGTGLGLSIVKHGAILHNAKIHVDSELGKGTRMELTF